MHIWNILDTYLPDDPRLNDSVGQAVGQGFWILDSGYLILESLLNPEPGTLNFKLETLN